MPRFIYFDGYIDVYYLVHYLQTLYNGSSSIYVISRSCFKFPMCPTDVL